MRKLERMAFAQGNWWFWLGRRNPVRVAANTLVCAFAMACPIPEIKNPLLRLIGMKVGKNAFIALGTALDVFYPELVEIGENAIIGYGCVITAHEMVQNELRVGKVSIGAGCTVGTRAVVLPGVGIGEGATVGAMSLVNCDVPAGKFYAGVPAKEIKGS